MLEENHRINNLDITIVAQAPRLSSHITAMRENIAADLSLGLSQVSVKATTTEKMGFVGREEGVAVFSSVLLTSNSD
jgi:2-C-methyl-D-erythritol 2,4-cyclodiphosphate synthase